MLGEKQVNWPVRSPLYFRGEVLWPQEGGEVVAVTPGATVPPLLLVFSLLPTLPKPSFLARQSSVWLPDLLAFSPPPVVSDYAQLVERCPGVAGAGR